MKDWGRGKIIDKRRERERGKEREREGERAHYVVGRERVKERE